MRDAIIGSMTEGLLVVDDAGELLVRNQAWPTCSAAPGTGSRPTPSTRWRAPASTAPRSPRRTRPTVRALRGETVRDVELRSVARGRRPRVIAVSAMPLPRDVIRDRARALVLFRDVTTEHAHREELAAFAGVVAHDLRNPLAAIDGWTEMIADELEAGELAPDWRASSWPGSAPRRGGCAS